MGLRGVPRTPGRRCPGRGFGRDSSSSGLYCQMSYILYKSWKLKFREINSIEGRPVRVTLLFDEMGAVADLRCHADRRLFAIAWSARRLKSCAVRRVRPSPEIEQEIDADSRMVSVAALKERHYAGRRHGVGGAGCKSREEIAASPDVARNTGGGPGGEAGFVEEHAGRHTGRGGGLLRLRERGAQQRGAQ